MKGFTLIELLITVAIVAVLASVAAPLAETTVQRGKEQELRRSLREIRTAIDAYKAAFDEGAVERKSGASGYPPSLAVLVEGVRDARSPDEKKLYFGSFWVDGFFEMETETGKVTRLTSFGAFVEILPGKDGLVRPGDLSEESVRRPEDVVAIGDEVMVMVIEVDDMGRVNLSRRAVMEGLSLEEAKEVSRQSQFATAGGRGGREPEGHLQAVHRLEPLPAVRRPHPVLPLHQEPRSEHGEPRSPEGARRG